jgi:hypothetical protein
MLASIFLGVLIGASLAGAYVASRAILNYVAASETAGLDKASNGPTDAAIADAKVTVYQMQRRFSTLVNH